MYSGKISLTSENAIPFLSIADRFAMQHLKTLAVEYIGMTTFTLTLTHARILVLALVLDDTDRRIDGSMSSIEH